MKQSINYTVNQCLAEITVKKNSIKKYNNDYYLSNGQEFEILLKNNTQDVVMATIKINGKLISNTGLVLKPGKKVYLERYLDQSKKFLFETYKVDNSTESLRAIENNGNVEISFYKEKQTQPIAYYTTNTPIGYPATINTCFNLTNSRGSGSLTYSSGTTSLNVSKGFSDNSSELWDSFVPEIETGRVEKGSYSDQKFVDYYGEFEQFAFKTISLKILPYSLKPVETRDLAQYCTNCGLKNRKSNWIFCPRCSTKFVI